MNTNQSDRRPIPARHHSVTKWIAGKLNEAGITPNAVSIFGLLCGIGAGLCLSFTTGSTLADRGLLFSTSLLILLRGLSNMFDGMIAVEHGKATPTGALVNEIPDRVSDVALFVGAGYAVGSHPTLGYLAAIIALLISFVRVAARNAGAPSDFGGLMAKQQRMFSVAGIALWLSLTPESWQPVLGADGRYGLISVCLALIILVGLQTLFVRLRRAATYLKRNTAR